jgi:hypothetical protein
MSECLNPDARAVGLEHLASADRSRKSVRMCRLERCRLITKNDAITAMSATSWPSHNASPELVFLRDGRTSFKMARGGEPGMKARLTWGRDGGCVKPRRRCQDLGALFARLRRAGYIPSDLPIPRGSKFLVRTSEFRNECV